MLRERIDLLKRYVPGLFEPGRLLYVGASPARFEVGPELAEVGHKITLLEVHEPYAEHYRRQPGMVQYVIQGDVRTAQLGACYDVAFWWHGPEHVPFEDVGLALARLEYHSKLVVVGCPWGEFPQESIDGNPHQAHQCALYPEDFRRWGYQVATCGQRDVRGQGYLIAWREVKPGPLRLPKTIACVIAYQEERMLPGCLESVAGQVDEIVVVDGAYARFPHEVPYSTDKTVEIALAYGARVIDCPEGKPWPNQVVKRTAYLVGEEGDWYLHIDADERLVGVLPVPQNGMHYAFHIFSRGGVASWSPRLWQHRGRMRYVGAHNALWSDDRLIHRKGATFVDPLLCRFAHLARYREVERQLDKREYYKWQKPHERAYRASLGI